MPKISYGWLPIWVLILSILSGCNGDATSTSNRPPALPQDASIQVYFNQNQAQGADYQEPYRGIERVGDDLEQKIIEAIASAQSTIKVAVYEFRLPRIAQALVEKHQAGVQVRVIVDNDNSKAFSDYTNSEITGLPERGRSQFNEFLALVDSDKNGLVSEAESRASDALVILREAGVPVLDDTADGSKGSGLMHHKFVVVDGESVVISSGNFTTSGIHGDFASPESRGNTNHLLTVTNPVLASQLQEEFNLMWGDGPGGQPDSRFGVQKPLRSRRSLQVGDTPVRIQFSPQSKSTDWPLTSNGFIAGALTQANQSVDLGLFVFSEQRLVDRLQERQRAGAQIRALIDRDFAFRDYSEGLDMLGRALARDCQYEEGNQPWQRAIASVGVPQLPQGDKLHHKFAVLDQRWVITGSHNWSAAANHQNDELVVLIDNPTVAAHFTREFERLYDQASLGLPLYVQERITEQEQACTAITNRGGSTMPGELINLNTADQAALESLPGIGPSLAERIIEAREHQSFTSLEDLDAVSGIGPAKIADLEGKVTW